MRPHHIRVGSHLRLIGAGLVIGALFVACSASSGSTLGGGGNGNGNGNGAAGTGATGQGGTLTFTQGGGGQGGLTACAGEQHLGKITPVDVVIMLDQSGSMSAAIGNSTSWGLVTGAITQFVNDPTSQDLGVGLQYFPLPASPCVSCGGCYQPDLQITDPSTNVCCCGDPSNETCAGADGTTCASGGLCFQHACYAGGTTDTCQVSAYASLDVPIGSVANNKAAIITSLGNHGPRGMTPTSSALSGAIQAAITQASAHQDHAVAVVLTTDGTPTECDPQDIPSIAALATTAAAHTPPIHTFVIGLGNVPALDSIAQAGGTGQAYVVDMNSDAAQAFLQALQAIHGSLLTCEFGIPAPTTGQLDYDLVNVEFTPSGAATEVLGRVANAAACGANGGWYYDNPGAPTKILLCPASCTKVKSYSDAALNIVLGCATVVN